MSKDNMISAKDATADLFFTAFVVTDKSDVITACNRSAETSLIGAAAVGRKLVSTLSEALKIGIISKATISLITAGLETGSSIFRTEDGRTFVLRSASLGDGRRVEWTDASALSAGCNDPTAGVLTRRGFLTAVASIRDVRPGVIIAHLAVDNFKDLDDLLGEVTVEHLSSRVKERIASQLETASAQLAHGLGGDFFFVISEEDAIPVTEALLEILARPYLVDGKIVHCTASIGTARLVDGDDPETILRNASLALKKARAEGGNQTRSFTIEMRDATQRKRNLELDLRKALALREFSLVYQPQYKIAGRELVGFEALLRWNHPQHGLVSPAEFIPLAEELGLISPIGEWVLKTACRKAASWPSNLSIAVNVSPLQFRNPEIVQTVTSALEVSHLEAFRLDLEITEGAILLNSMSIMETFRQLKAIGIRFSMDDFGTGFSSLSYLQRFPFDKIKIDQSFVRGLPSSGDSLAIINAICLMGRSLGLTTIAEGVETEDQLSLIERHGCVQVQGYLTGRPLAPELADQLVASII